MILTTQRTQALNKAVLDLIETLFIMRMLSPRARKAIQEWIQEKHEDDEKGILSTLDSLPAGTAQIWSPLRGILEKVALRRIRTFDSYRTPPPGEVLIEPSARRELDLDALGAQMKSTVEKAKAEDPKELQKRVQELSQEAEYMRLRLFHCAELSGADLDGEREPRGTSKELADWAHECVRQLRISYDEALNETPEEKVVEVPVLEEGELERLEAAIAELHSSITEVQGTAGELQVALDEGKLVRAELGHPPDPATLVKMIKDVEIPPRPMTGGLLPGPSLDAPLRQPLPQPPAEPVDLGDYKLTGLPQEMLMVMAAFHPRELTKKQLATFTGKKSSAGYFNNKLSELRSQGLVDGLSITQAGLDAVGGPSAPPSPAELRAMWREKFNGLPLEMFDLLVANPDGLTKQQLAEATGKSPNAGYFNNMLSKLRGNEVVEVSGQVNRLVPELLG
jgi:hypothetical protein